MHHTIRRWILAGALTACASLHHGGHAPTRDLTADPGRRQGGPASDPPSADRS